MAAPGGHASAQTTSSEKPNTGLALLKAKKLAAAPDLDSFAALRLFFNAVQNDDDNILKRAGHLLHSLSGEDEESARRISAAASLTLESGRASKVRIAEEYRLPPGTVGWDFGAEDSVLHPGFNLVSPSDFSNQSGDASVHANPAVSGSALADGVDGVYEFKSALENGVYRILIVYPQSKSALAEYDEDGHPFGPKININGAEVETHPTDSTIAATNMTNGGDSKPTLTIGVQTWVVVSNGELTIDF
ncbi:MAG: hypothetical protein JKY20_11235, partial [Alphaproteobacteria bacterium]|nr:hypothetical protein [Alphaproteobacteria bacterium]